MAVVGQLVVFVVSLEDTCGRASVGFVKGLGLYSLTNGLDPAKSTDHNAPRAENGQPGAGTAVWEW